MNVSTEIIHAGTDETRLWRGVLSGGKTFCLTTALLFGSLGARAENLIVSEGTVTVSTSAAYDAIVVSGGATLVVNGGAVLTARTATVGQDGTAGTLDLSGGASLEVSDTLHLATNTVLACGGAVTVSDGATLTAFIMTGEGATNDGTHTDASSQITLNAGGTWIGRATLSSDVGFKVLFAGGTMMPTTAQDNVFHNWALGAAKLEFAIAEGADAVFDTSGMSGFCLLVYVYSWAGYFTMSGTGDVVIRDSRGAAATGGVFLPLCRNRSEYPFVGGVRLEGGVSKFQGTSAFGSDRVWTISPTAKLFLDTYDNKVVDQSVKYMAGGGTVANALMAQANLTFTDFVPTNDLSFVGDIALNYAPGSGGTMRCPNALPTKLAVVSGTVEAVSLRCPGRFRSYRFKIDGVKQRCEGAPQLSELTFYEGATNVMSRKSAVSWGVATIRANESPAKLFDGDVTTKWCDAEQSFGVTATEAKAEACWVQVDFPDAQRVTAYSWCTANDSPDRDPAAWRLFGSNDGGVTWQLIDTRTGFAATADRCALAGTFDVDEVETTVTDWGEDVDLTASGAGTFRLNGRTLGLSSALILSSPVWTNGATVRTGGATGTNLLQNLRLAGDASLVKVGANTVRILGENSHTGATRVAGGTLLFGGFGTTNKFFRYTIRKNGGASEATQISEFAFYGVDGSRTGLNLTHATKGTAAAALTPGSVALGGDWTENGNESVAKLFDGNLGTKWCQAGRVPTTGSEETWIGFVCRLADDAPPVASFLMATANDVITRSPTSWILETSPDGATWTTIDERADAAYPSAFKTWFNGGAPYAFSGYEAPPACAFSSASEVSVAAGATLDLSDSLTKVGRLAVDMDGAGDGTIIGLDAAATGSLDVRGLASGARLANRIIPLVFEQPVQTATLRAWQVLRDGEPTNERLGFRDGRLVILPRGFLFVVK